MVQQWYLLLLQTVISCQIIGMFSSYDHRQSSRQPRCTDTCFDELILRRTVEDTMEAIAKSKQISPLGVLIQIIRNHLLIVRH